jgi:hypothetical protein
MCPAALLLTQIAAVANHAAMSAPVCRYTAQLASGGADADTYTADVTLDAVITSK